MSWWSTFTWKGSLDKTAHDDSNQAMEARKGSACLTSWLGILLMREAGGVPVRRIICCSWFMSKTSELRATEHGGSKSIGWWGSFVWRGGRHGWIKMILTFWQKRMVDYLDLWTLSLDPGNERMGRLLEFIAHVGKNPQEQNQAIRKTLKILNRYRFKLE